MKEELNQRVIRREFKSWLGPQLLLGALLINLIWEILKSNLEPQLRHEWPWRLIVLDRSTTATLAGIAATLILTRSQLSKSMHPSLGWSARESLSRYIKRSRRTIWLNNAGPGRALVHEISYRLDMAEGSATPERDTRGDEWMEWGEVIDRIERQNLKHHKDFFVLHLGVGAGIPAGGLLEQGLEIAAFNERTISRLSRFDIRIQVIDIIGDRHERVIRCLRIREYAHEARGRTLPTRHPGPDLPAHLRLR